MAGDLKYTPEVLAGIVSFGTARQQEVINKRLEGLTWRQVANHCGISETKAKEKARACMKAAIKRGWSPEHDMTKTVPDGFMVKGVSTLYDHEGKQRAQWVKSQSDRDRQKEILLERIENAFSTGRKPFTPTKAPAKVEV